VRSSGAPEGGGAEILSRSTFFRRSLDAQRRSRDIVTSHVFAGADLDDAGVLVAGDAHCLREIVAVAENSCSGEADVNPLQGVGRIPGVGVSRAMCARCGP
jgi:hypothetical protein